MPKQKPGPKSLVSTKNSGAPKVAVVITVFNEEDNIVQLLEAVFHQTLLPFEVAVVDGGSGDKTFSSLQKCTHKYPRLKVYSYKGNRSIGRNFGVSHTSSPLIAFTDAGCFPESDWLEKLVRPFQDPAVQVVSGYYRGQYQNIFQKCLIPYVLVMPDKANVTEFYPSTRSMGLRRTVWNRSGGFDIRLSHNEDYAYAHWLKKLGYSFTFVADAIVNWLPRKDISASFWMILRFALGDIQSGIIRPQVKRLFIRFAFFLFLLSLSIEVPIILVPTLVIVFIYLIWSVKKNYKYVIHPAAIFWLPVIQLTADTAVIMGTIIGALTKK